MDFVDNNYLKCFRLWWSDYKTMGDFNRTMFKDNEGQRYTKEYCLES